VRSKTHAVCLVLALAGCDAKAPRVATHVEDWRDRVIYQIVTDRFANGDPGNDGASGVDPVPGDLARIQGGDWRGIAEHLDYVAALGMSAVWISPVVRNVARTEDEDGYHGYWASDFTQHEPRFGTLAELQDLVHRAHARGIAIIVDVVPNHAGRVFAYDLDGDGALDEGEDLAPFRAEPYTMPLLWHGPRPRLFSPEGGLLELSASHFHRQGIGNLASTVERRRGDFPTGLRDLDTEQEAVIEAMIETHAEWVLRTDVDGFRIDAVPHVELPFWTRFCDGLRRRLDAEGKRNFFLLGEIFEFEAPEIARYTGPGALDAGFDFPTKFALINGVILGGAPPSSARAALESQRALFRATPQPFGVGLGAWEARVAIADNHDLPRVRSEVGDPFAVDQALVAIFTLDAIPGVYYGTERDFTGRVHHDAREVLWTRGFAEDGPSFSLIARLAAVRRGSVALRRGDLVVRHASEEGGRSLEDPAPDAGLLVWERASGQARALVVFNTHPVQTSVAQVQTGWAEGTALEERLGGQDALEVGPEGRVSLSVPPRTSWILEPAGPAARP
jgi:glycosidase